MDNDTSLNWNDMRFLLALERHGSAIKAARKLGVSHQTVSRRLAELEQGPGARLVDRSGLNWQLTVCGQEVVKQAEEIEGAMRAAAHLARATSPNMAGRVRFILPALVALRQEHPLIEFDLVADSAPLDLQSGQFDIAVRFVKSAPGHLLGRNTGALEFALYGPPEWIDILDRAVAQNHLVNLPVVAMPTPHLRSGDWLKGVIDPASLTTRTGELGLLLSSVQNGLGVGFLPVVAGREMRDLRECRSIPRKAPFDIWVLTNEESRKSAKIRAVASALFTHIQTTLTNA